MADLASSDSPQCSASTSGVLGDDVAVQMAVHPERLQDLLFLLGRDQITAGFLQGLNGILIDVVQYGHRVF